jgi:hypothetical protein
MLARNYILPTFIKFLYKYQDSCRLDSNFSFVSVFIHSPNIVKTVMSQVQVEVPTVTRIVNFGTIRDFILIKGLAWK